MTEVTPWELKWQGNILFPVDDRVHAAATKFCEENLASKLDPRQFSRLWIAQRGGRVLGVTGIRPAQDIACFRSIDKPASYAMAERLNAYFSDNGLLGHDVFLFLSDQEKPEQRCPNRDEVLAVWNGRPAERYIVRCR
jgi:hypothetical protein